MCTFSINIDSAKSCYLRRIKDDLFYLVTNANGFQRLSESDGRCYLDVSVSDEYRERVALSVKSAVAEAIALGFKIDYLSDKLKFLKNSLLSRTLVNAMSIFDNSADKKIAYSAIDNLTELSLDGLFLFRLGKLKNRWDEIASVTQGNGFLLSGDKLCTEFLQYLITSVPSAYGELTLDKNLHRTSLYDENGAPVPALRLWKSAPYSEEEEILFTLVTFAPRRLTVTGDKHLFSEEFLSLISDLFPARSE